jgi:hypothetical protein
MPTELPPYPDPSLDERAMLTSYLDLYRSVLIRKAEGLTVEAASRTFPPSTMSVLGLVKHMADVENWWFELVFTNSGRVLIPEVDDDPDVGFRIGPGETVESVVAMYRDECDHSRATVAAHELADVAARDGRNETLRWILVHMIEETARHAGHADIFREQIDGAVGD